LLGFRVLFYIDLEKYVDKAFRELPIDQTQLKAFLNSEFDNRIQITSLIPWLQLSPLFGISIPWHKDDMPSVTNLKNTAGEQCTLGSIIYQLSRDQNKKNDTLPLSDTTYAFFIEYLLCMVHKNKNVIPQIIDLLKFSSDQFYIDSKDGILNEPKPQEIPNSNGISEAWKLAHQYSSFSYSFLRRFCNALSDSDDQFHDQTSELLTVLNEDAKTRDEETELCKAIIIHMLKQDTMSHDNTLIPFIQSIYDTFLRYAKDSDRPAWAQLFYDLSLEQLNGSNIVLGFSRDIVKLLKFPVPEDEAAQYDPTKVDLDASATQLENYLSLNDERMIIVTHNMLKELGLDFMYQIFPASENNGLYISIVPDSLNKLVHVQIVIGIDDLTIFRYTIDTSTVPYIIHATVLDPEIIRVHTDVTNVLVYIAHKSIETFNIWNNQKETERKEELEKKNIAKQNHNPKP